MLGVPPFEAQDVPGHFGISFVSRRSSVRAREGLKVPTVLKYAVFRPGRRPGGSQSAVSGAKMSGSLRWTNGTDHVGVSEQVPGLQKPKCTSNGLPLYGQFLSVGE